MTAGRYHPPTTARTEVYGGLATGARDIRETLEGGRFMAHTPPGMKVIVPSTPRDGKCLARLPGSSTRIPGWSLRPSPCKGKRAWSQLIPASRSPLGQADVKRPGSDITLISYGRSVLECLAAAQDAPGPGCQHRGHRSPHTCAARCRHHRGVGAPHPGTQWWCTTRSTCLLPSRNRSHAAGGVLR